MVVQSGEKHTAHNADVLPSSPPPYASSSYEPGTGTDAPKLLQRVPPPIARCNLLAIKRTAPGNAGRLTGSFVVDPTLDVPAEMLAPLKSTEERKNLLLHAPNSSINVDVWVVDSKAAAAVLANAKSACTTIDVRSERVTLRLHETVPWPFALTVCATSGDLHLDLPRSFRGPLTIRSADGQVSFSPELEPLVTTFSDYDGLRKAFVGDFAALGFGKGIWEDSHVHLDVRHGKAKLRFADESEPPAAPARPWWYFGYTGES